jgi:hypothetical protein
VALERATDAMSYCAVGFSGRELPRLGGPERRLCASLLAPEQEPTTSVPYRHNREEAGFLLGPLLVVKIRGLNTAA